MRKIIRGKLYDTETAREVGYVSNAMSGDDYRRSTLYRKRTGEFFICSQVGEYDIAEAIEPLTYEMARQWAEEHLDADEYTALFGEPAEGCHDLHVVISSAAYQALSRTASVEGTTIGGVIERLALA